MVKFLKTLSGSILRYLPITLLIWPPLVRGAAKDIELLALLAHALIVAALCSLASIFSEKDCCGRPRFLPLVAGMTGFAAVSVILSVYPRGSLEEAGIYAMYIFVFLWASSIRDRKTVDAHLKLMSCVAAAVAVVALIRYYFGVDDVWGKPAYEVYKGRATGTYMNPGHAACFMAMLFPFLVHRIMRSKGLRVALWGISSLAVAVAVWLTYSRGGLLAVGVEGLVIIAVTVAASRKIPAAGKAAVMLLCVAAGCAGVWSVSSLRRNPQLHDLEVSGSWAPGEGDSGVETRYLIYRDTLKMIKDRPLFGSGPGTYEFVYPHYRGEGMYELANAAHNDYLQNASEFGVAFAALFVVMIAACLVSASEHFRDDEPGRRTGAAIRCAAVMGFCTFMLVDFNLRIPANGMMFFYLLGICAGMGRGSGVRSAAGRGRAGFLFVLVAVGCVILMLTLSRWISARENYNDAVAASEGDDLIRAAALSSASVALDPGNYYYRLLEVKTTVKAAGASRNKENIDRARGIALDLAATTEFDGRPLVYAARAALLTGDNKAAEEYARAAMDIEPRNAAYMDNLVLYLQLWRRREEALELVEKSCRALPRRYMHYYIQAGKWDAGIYDAAARGFSQAWRDLGDPEAVAALMMLSREAMDNRDCALPRMVFGNYSEIINESLADRIRKRCVDTPGKENISR